jgi:hypothetical protein
MTHDDEIGLGQGHAARSPEPIFFIEPYAHQCNGHSPANVVAHTAAALAEGAEPFVVVSQAAAAP